MPTPAEPEPLLPAAKAPPTAGKAASRPAFGLIPQTTRSDQVADALRQAIITGVFQPGEQLKQDALRAEFGLSPAPVREAMRQLENEGLIIHRPNSGAFVAEVPIEDVLGLVLPVRLAIERYGVIRAMDRLTEADFQQLEDLIAVMSQGADARDHAKINAADVRFHQITIEASGSYQAIQLWHSVLPRIRVTVHRLAQMHHRLQYIPEEHRRLLMALRSGQPDAVAQELEQHIIGVNKELTEAHSQPDGRHADGGESGQAGTVTKVRK